MQVTSCFSHLHTHPRPIATHSSAPSEAAGDSESRVRERVELSNSSTAPKVDPQMLAQQAMESLRGVAATDLPGALSVAVAQMGVRALEQTTNQKEKAATGALLVDFLAGYEADAETSTRAENLMQQVSPQSSGAGAAYLTMLRDVAMKDAETVPGTGFDLNHRDMDTSPTQDFYQHINGGWIEQNPIPSDQPRWGRFNELRDASTRIQQEILEEYSAGDNHPQGSTEQKLGDFYYSAMDTQAIEAAGLTPVQPMLDAIASIDSPQSLASTLGQLHNQGLPGLFVFGSEIDSHDSTMQIAAAYQGGLGLPSKEYYLKEDEDSVALRQDYQSHVQTMFELLGDSPEAAQANAAAVMNLETRLARVSLSSAEARDPQATYNIKNRQELGEMSPNFDWNAYLDGRGLSQVETVNAGMPTFFQGVSEILGDSSTDDVKAYLRWNLINSMAGSLPARFDEADFDFYGKRLGGVETRQARDKRMASVTNGYLGMALGQAYVDRAFPPEAKQRAEDMIEHIRGAIADHVTSLDWMSPETKGRALDKLEKVGVKVGYPDEWPSYDGLEVERGVHANNVLRGKAFGEAQDLAKIGQPVDRGEWHMTPATVNAYYSPSGNEIVFPAAILQPPFFDAEADDPINYGGIGVVIGHEFTHGFDDQGSQFDGDGNLKNWWKESDLEQFQTRANSIRQQANAYEVEPGLNLNGDLVLGESLADLGGVMLSLTALQNSLAGGSFDQKVDGFTPEQRFFQGFGQIWATNARPEYVRQQVQNDPHPVAPFRVNQTLKNVPAFAAAYEAAPGDAMTLPEDERADLW